MVFLGLQPGLVSDLSFEEKAIFSEQSSKMLTPVYTIELSWKASLWTISFLKIRKEIKS